MVVPLVPVTLQTPAVVVGSIVNTTGFPDAPPVADNVAVVPAVAVVGAVNVMFWAVRGLTLSQPERSPA